MELQSIPLNQEIEYGIDVLLDEMSIDCASANVLVLYGDRAVIQGIMDAPMPDEEFRDLCHWRSTRLRTRETAIFLMDYATDLIAGMPRERQGALASVALTHMDYTTRRTAEFMAHWAIGDKAEGGYGEDYNRPPRCQKNSVWPYKKDVRRLYAPAWIRRYVKHEDECRRVRKIGQVVSRRLERIDPALITGGIEIFRTDFEESERRRHDYESRQWEQMRADIEIGTTANEALLEPKITLKKKALARQRLRQRQERKILKRGLVTATMVVGESKTRAFLKGEPVLLEGVNFNLLVTKRSRAAALDFSQIGLAATTKDGAKLADLCFYVENTPAIDQLTAVALHTAAGEEQDIINIANIINLTPGAIDHPAFSAKREVDAARRILAAADTGTITRINEGTAYIPNLAIPHMNVAFRDAASDRNEKYWRDTQHIWIEATGVFLLGAKYQKLMKQHASTP